MSLEARRVRIEDVRRVWPLIASEIKRCMEEDATDATAYDVQAALLVGDAVLYLVCDEDDAYHGLLVLQHVSDVFSGRQSVHIWYAMGASSGIGSAALDLVDSIARANGAEYVTFKCRRRSVVRWAERRGFEVNDIEMKREVTS